MQVVYDFTWQPQGAEGQPESITASAADSASQAPLTPSTSADPVSAELQPEDKAQLLSSSQMACCYPIAALPSNAEQAVQALQKGRVIAVPTDTLYGLAADANSSSGIQQIYSIKHRQAYAPLAICIADVTDLSRYCSVAHLPVQLLQQLLPGPVTLVLSRKAGAPLSPELNPGLETIGESAAGIQHRLQ